MGLAEYINEIQKITDVILSEDRIIVIHHNDADGLSSATVLIEGFRRLGKDLERVALERTHPEILKRLFNKFSGLFVFVDLGAGNAPAIASFNREFGNKVIIIDHHAGSRVNDKNIHVLTTEFYGLSGDRDISAASAAYIFVKSLGVHKGLSYLGVIGAIGDSHHRFGRLESVNRMVLNEAVREGSVKIEVTSNNSEKYYLTKFGYIEDIESYAKLITMLGAAGFLLDGPEVAIDSLMRGRSKPFDEKVKEINSIKQRAFDSMVDYIKNKGMAHSKFFQWIDVGERFHPMGVKAIGEFLMEIRNSDFIDQSKYIAGFQSMPRIVPKLGEFDWDLKKVSLRLPARLEADVIKRRMPGYDYLVPRAAPHVGGDIDACHGYACATTFNSGLEKKFIDILDKLVEDYLRERSS